MKTHDSYCSQGIDPNAPCDCKMPQHVFGNRLTQMMYDTLEHIALIEACSNSDPDIMGRALDNAIGSAQKTIMLLNQAYKRGERAA